LMLIDGPEFGAVHRMIADFRNALVFRCSSRFGKDVLSEAVDFACRRD
jgi:hypothetical protein